MVLRHLRAARQFAVRHLLGSPASMLEQVRRLFLRLCLLWPVYAVPALLTQHRILAALAVAATTAGLAAWWLRGYRRQAFPIWDWAASAAGIAIILAAAGYESGLSMAFAWLALRALYGTAREKVYGGLAATAVLISSGLAAGMVDTVLPDLFTLFVLLPLIHTTGRFVAARDRAVVREAVLRDAYSALMAVPTRATAIDTVLVSAMALDPAIDGAAILVGHQTLTTEGTTGRAGGAGDGASLEAGQLPVEARSALAAGTGARLTGDGAARLAEVARLVPGVAILIAALSVREEPFGLLVVALRDRPADDLSGAVNSLAGQAALALDQLLASERFRALVENAPDAHILASTDGRIRFTNPTAQRLLGMSAAQLGERDLSTLVHPDDLAALLEPAPNLADATPRLYRIRGNGSGWLYVEAAVVGVTEHDGSTSLLINARDVSDRQRLEAELRHAQKLESVGRLAAGIAHEINTPVQFVSDNVRFLQQAFNDLLSLHHAYIGALEEAAGATQLDRMLQLEADMDIDFVVAEAPEAFAQTLEGVDRVAVIVRAMKAFGHPNGADKEPVNLNEAIATTIVVANNELKYVADVRTRFAELPPVTCYVGDINQVVVNLVVNAAHAVAAAAPSRGRGVVEVTTRLDGDHVVIEVSDSGTGIPPEIADKIFDPFFTTKEVGTGTGQGLALARALVVDRHGGRIGFVTEADVGTTFTVRLPIGSDNMATVA
jgi:PAS domain S-box-containing protein